MESARMLPDDMMVMVSVESVNGLRTAVEKTSLYGLYKDPAMQEFVTGSEKKIREAIETTLKGFWQKMQIENPPEQIPDPRRPAGPGHLPVQAPGRGGRQRGRIRAATTRASVSRFWRIWAVGRDRPKR